MIWVIFHDIGGHLGQKRGFLEPHFDSFWQNHKSNTENGFLDPKNVLLHVSHICMKYTMLQNVFLRFSSNLPQIIIFGLYVKTRTFKTVNCIVIMYNTSLNSFSLPIRWLFLIYNSLFTTSIWYMLKNMDFDLILT